MISLVAYQWKLPNPKLAELWLLISIKHFYLYAFVWQCQTHWMQSDLNILTFVSSDHNMLPLNLQFSSILSCTNIKMASTCLDFSCCFLHDYQPCNLVLLRLYLIVNIEAFMVCIYLFSLATSEVNFHQPIS